MKRLFTSVFLLISGLGLIFFTACTKSSGDNIQIVSTDIEENSVVSVTTGYVNYVFNTAISVADTAKITLNGVRVSAVRAYDTNLRVTINSLVSGTDYILTIDKGAIEDGSNKLNTVAFTLHFKTAEGPVIGGSVTQNGFLSVNGASLVNKDGKALVLHGVSFGWHNWWPRFYTESTVTWLKTDWNCNYVRAAIGVDAEGAYLTDPALALSCLYSVVDAAIKNDIYVIVDWHIVGSNFYKEDSQKFFQTVAEKYNMYPNIIYEIVNEPDDKTSWSSVKAYAEAVIGTIRAIDAKNIILVGSPSWDQNVNLPAADPIKDYKNIMYTLHFYADSHGQSLRNVATAALQKGLPLFVSECGSMNADGAGNINTAEWNNWLQWMSQTNISWAAWSLSDKDETCSMILNTSSPVSGWTDSDLKDWGKIVRTQLRSY